MFKRLQTSVVPSTQNITFSFTKIDDRAFLPIFWYFSISDNGISKVSNNFHTLFTISYYHFTNNSWGFSCFVQCFDEVQLLCQPEEQDQQLYVQQINCFDLNQTPYSLGRSTCYFNRLRDFSVTIRRCYKDVYVNNFFPPIVRMWNSLPIECFLLTYDLNGFKCKINRHLLTVGSF